MRSDFAARPAGDTRAAPAVTWHRLSPSVLWGALGAASVVFIVVVLALWLADGVTTIDPGPDAYDGWRLVLLRVVLEGLQFAVMLVLVARLVVRPLLRRAELGFDALFLLGAMALNFWDPMDNYASFNFQYNANFVHVTSWGDQIPGFSAGGDTWVVPVFFALGAYTWAFYAAAVMGCAIVDRLGERRPGMSVARRFGVAWLGLTVIAIASENIYLLTGAIANIQTPDSLTAWTDSYDGWPVYNPVFFAAAWTATAWLRWSRDESGLSAVERGVRALPFGQRWQTLVRFLAIFAFVQVTYLLLYFLPWNLFSIGVDPLSDLPSYFPVPD